MNGHRQAMQLLLAATAGVVVSACGSTVKLPEGPPVSAFAADQVGFKQTGNANASIDQSSIRFSADATGTLVVNLTLTSQASGRQTIAVRCSVFNSAGTIVGDAAGGQVGVDPGSTIQLQLNGPPPDGTIASATFEVTATPS